MLIIKKKPKKKVYYGIKTKKAFTRKGYGDKTTIELFYVLKKPDLERALLVLRKALEDYPGRTTEE